MEEGKERKVEDAGQAGMDYDGHTLDLYGRTDLACSCQGFPAILLSFTCSWDSLTVGMVR